MGTGGRELEDLGSQDPTKSMILPRLTTHPASPDSTLQGIMVRQKPTKLPLDSARTP
jgi:hypothetical protein